VGHSVAFLLERVEATSLAKNLPRRVGRYDIAARIAFGGSPIDSEVFIAVDSIRRKPLAIKRLAPLLTRDSAKLATYVASAWDVAKRLKHPNVVEIRGVGSEKDDVHLVMDYVAGETLDRFVRQLHETGKTLPTAPAAYIVAEICAGLDAAHKLGFVHGLITPHDVLVGYDGSVRLLDVGVASARAVLAGTEIAQVRDVEVQYSSPEVCRGQAADSGSDVFSVGAVLWELLTGVAPFERASRAATIKAICDEGVASPNNIRRDAELPAAIESATMDALARDPEKRCPDAAKLRELLLAHVGATKAVQAELVRLMEDAFARRKADKAKLVERLSMRQPSTDLGDLDVIDDVPDGEPVHGADLDAKSPSGIAPKTAGKVEEGPTVIVDPPPSDPAFRSGQPVPPAAPKVAAAADKPKAAGPKPPASPMIALDTQPVIVPQMPSRPTPIEIEPEPDQPVFVETGATLTMPHERTPAPAPLKPEYVPVFDRAEAERSARAEPTALVDRPPSGFAPALPVKKTPKALLAVLLLLLIGGTLGVVVVLGRAKKPDGPVAKTTATATTPVATTAAPAVSTAPVAPAPSATAEPAPSTTATTEAAPDTITLSIDTVPTHGTIVLDGKKMGTAPLELQVPKGKTEMLLEIQRAGYVTLKERIVPDMNQRLKLSLVAAKGAGGKGGAKNDNPYKKFE
jgi:serine/threonine-protein kinase